VIVRPAATGADLWHACALRAADAKQDLVADAHGGPSQLPGESPGAILAQAWRAEPRAPDPHLAFSRTARDLVKRATGIPAEQHPLENLGKDPGCERGVLELLGGQRDAMARGGQDASGGRLQAERPDHIAGFELEGVRVAGDVAEQALPVDRGEPERQAPHAAACRGCWRPAPTSAA
jgi:hypothetical protein